MLREEILAMDPGIFRDWKEQLKAADLAALLEGMRSPEAATRLVPGRKSVGDVAIVGLSGFITQKPSLFSMLFGGTSAESFAREVVGALNDGSVGAVVMNVDSPGGSVFGMTEAAAAIRAARGPKPLVAVANPIMASGAYYLAAQADEIAATPSAVVGSIGTIGVHIDESKALENEGLKVTEITYGRRKAERSGAKPLSEEGLASWQAMVDYYGKLFELDVSKGRKTPLETVRSNYGEGGVFTAAAAKDAGLVDRLATLDQVVSELGNGRKTEPGPRAFDPTQLAARAALAGVKIEGWVMGQFETQE